MIKGEVGSRELLMTMQQNKHLGCDRVYDIIEPGPTILSDFTTARREPSRPPELREPGFDREFDHTTLFYDAFRAPGSSDVLVIAPPFLNLTPAIKSMRVRAAPSGDPCHFRIEALDLCARVRIDAPPASDALLIDSDLGSFALGVGENFSDLFRGLRTLFTLSKNNSLMWVLDWVRYHRDIHGAEAALIYDNASTVYDARELSEAVAQISGIKRTCVVEWPFKYGPQGDAAGRFWDSNFCQHGVWEHARWRFLTEARSVLNGDIDELVVSSTGRTVFQMAERSLAGVVSYFGAWIIGIEGVTPAHPHASVPRHRDFDVMLLPGKPVRKLPWSPPEFGCPPKWTVVPSSCPSWTQWKVHTIGRWPPARLVSRGAGFRHFREIGDSWKYDRSKRDPSDPARHAYDRELRAALDRVRWDE
jgi:hypothetical protein